MGRRSIEKRQSVGKLGEVVPEKKVKKQAHKTQEVGKLRVRERDILSLEKQGREKKGPG